MSHYVTLCYVIFYTYSINVSGSLIISRMVKRQSTRPNRGSLQPVYHCVLLCRIMSSHVTLRRLLYILYQCFRESDHFSDGEETEYETKQRILAASLPFVHTLGWTQNAIAKGITHSTLRNIPLIQSGVSCSFFVVNLKKQIHVPQIKEVILQFFIQCLVYFGEK